MGIVIGMDEAGYGPNLGPLVVTATVWEVPGSPRRFDWWGKLANVLTDAPEKEDDRLHVADSKAVYSPARGLGPLERSVLSLLGTCDGWLERLRKGKRDCGTAGPCFCRLHEWLTATLPDGDADGPWFAGRDVPLPLVERADGLVQVGERLRDAFAGKRIGLRAIRSEIVQPARFNGLMHGAGNKAAALSRVSARLLRSVWDPEADGETYVVCDKHGGRNRYDPVLAEVLDGQMIRRMEEGRDLSRYRVGRTQIEFRTQAESHLPVAVASMVSKYVRELAMELFNAFWTEHVPGLKPTKGYPGDARRFRDDVDATRRKLGIADDLFWRER